MKQRDAVYAAVISVFADAGIKFADGSNASTYLSTDKTLRAKIQAIVIAGFKAGQVAFEPTDANKTKMSNPAELSKYVSGLVSNWLRKDTRLNGNVKYEAKNPGTRVGSSDPQLKALRQLAARFKNDPTKFSEIQNHISTRAAAIQADKAKSIKVDLSVLPAELVEELGLSTSN